jgi:hypothetical protein
VFVCTLWLNGRKPIFSAHCTRWEKPCIGPILGCSFPLYIDIWIYNRPLAIDLTLFWGDQQSIVHIGRKLHSYIIQTVAVCVEALHHMLAQVEHSLRTQFIYDPYGSTRQGNQGLGAAHRYLIPRLSLKAVYLWRHVSSTAPQFILWWWNLEILFAPLNRALPS